MSKKIVATNVTSSGRTSKSSKVKGGECLFPFIHKGELRNKCVDGANGKWCATEVNNKRQMLSLVIVHLMILNQLNHYLQVIHLNQKIHPKPKFLPKKLKKLSKGKNQYQRLKKI